MVAVGRHAAGRRNRAGAAGLGLVNPGAQGVLRHLRVDGLTAVCFGGVGALLVRRRPRHPVGWIFVAAGLVMAVDFADRLKDAVDLDSIRDDLSSVVQAALEPAHLSVWTSRCD